MKFLGYKLRNLRDAKEISLLDLEKMTGIGNGHLSAIERGEKNPQTVFISIDHIEHTEVNIYGQEEKIYFIEVELNSSGDIKEKLYKYEAIFWRLVKSLSCQYSLGIIYGRKPRDGANISYEWKGELFMDFTREEATAQALIWILQQEQKQE